MERSTRTSTRSRRCHPSASVTLKPSTNRSHTISTLSPSYTRRLLVLQHREVPQELPTLGSLSRPQWRGLTSASCSSSERIAHIHSLTARHHHFVDTRRHRTHTHTRHTRVASLSHYVASPPYSIDPSIRARKHTLSTPVDTVGSARQPPFADSSAKGHRKTHDKPAAPCRHRPLTGKHQQATTPTFATEFTRLGRDEKTIMQSVTAGTSHTLERHDKSTKVPRMQPFCSHNQRTLQSGPLLELSH